MAMHRYGSPSSIRRSATITARAGGSSEEGRVLRIATRGSKLALLQAQQVADALQAAARAAGCGGVGIRTVCVTTRGDTTLGASLRALGPGAFTQEVDQAVLDGDADVAVHSLKDAPPDAPAGLRLAACLPREDVRDAVIFAADGCSSLGDLPPGSKVGTSSSRRRVQILRAFPQLRVVPLRGSVQARLEALNTGAASATVLALSGLKRLGLAHVASQLLSTDVMLPAACQGAIGAMCREDDECLTELLARACHVPTLLEVAAERACLNQLMAGDPPSLPPLAVAITCRAHCSDGEGAAGSSATQVASNTRDAGTRTELDLEALIASHDGQFVERVGGSCCWAGADPDAGPATSDLEQHLQAAGQLGGRYGAQLAGSMARHVAAA